jgi:hypothetical protein
VVSERDASSAGASHGRGASKDISDQKAAKLSKKRSFPQSPQVACPNQPRNFFLRDIPGEFSRSSVLREIPGIRILLLEENRITNTNVTYTWDVPQTRAVREIPGGMSRKASCGKSQVRCPAGASCGKSQMGCPAKGGCGTLHLGCPAVCLKASLKEAVSSRTGKHQQAKFASALPSV